VRKPIAKKGHRLFIITFWKQDYWEARLLLLLEINMLLLV